MVVAVGALSSSRSDSPSGPSGVSVLPTAPMDFFTSSVFDDGALLPRACSTGLALDDDFCIAAFNTSALHNQLSK